MDPDLEAQLRLADRRGVLSGASLSEVQEFAAQVMLMVDARERSQGFFDDLRSRMVAARPERVHEIFPEWRDAAEVERAAYGLDEHGEADVDRMDDSLVQWRVPASTAERADLDRWLAEHATGTATAAELAAPGGEWL